MTIQSRCAAAFLISILGVVACGSSGTTTGAGGAGGGAGGDPTASPCYAYCKSREAPAQGGKMDCNPSSTIEDCIGYTNGCVNYDTLSAACKAAYMAYWSCTAAQANPCDNPGSCTAQATALGTACN